MHIEAIPNAQGLLVVPQHVPNALSTDGQFEQIEVTPVDRADITNAL